MSSPSSPIPRPHQNEPIWSRSEKAIARAAFDAALSQELHEVIQEAKRMANEIQKSSDLWDLEHHLTNAVKRLIANTTFAVRDLQMCWGDSCTKIDSARKICADCERGR